MEDYRPHSWVSVEEPTDEELDSIATRYKIDIGLLQDAMDINELPRVEHEDGVLCVFTRFVYGYGTRVLTAPILIVMTRRSLLTVSPKSLPFLERFLNGKISFNTISHYPATQNPSSN
jgi:Mg2+ and Co2+ transporter CorA